MHNNLEVV